MVSQDEPQNSEVLVILRSSEQHADILFWMQNLYGPDFFTASFMETTFAFYFSQVTATDNDCGTNSVIYYSLSAEGVVPPAEFQINRDTGVISLKSKLDYETKRLHEFPVMAVDRGIYLLSYFLTTQFCFLGGLCVYVNKNP